MEKFSIYDLLALILPGALFLFFLSVFNNLFLIVDVNLQYSQWEMFLGVYLCLIIIFGALLYVTSFWSKDTLFNKVFKFHIQISNIYHCKNELSNTMSDVLNQKSQEWFNTNIFNSEIGYNSLSEDNKENQSILIDKFYDRMYYELEYLNLIETPKTFQSFYLFFREIMLASFILIVLGLVLWFLSFTCLLTQPECHTAIITFIVLLFCLITSVILAKWYRKRMVLKMFWAYFTYLNHKNN